MTLNLADHSAQVIKRKYSGRVPDPITKKERKKKKLKKN